MAKIELKGIIQKVGIAQNVGTGDFMIQRFVFLEPAFTDMFGDKRGTDNIWQIKILGADKIQTFGITPEMVEQKATLIVYLDSKEVKGTNGKEYFYPIEANLGKFELFNPKA